MRAKDTRLFQWGDTRRPGEKRRAIQPDTEVPRKGDRETDEKISSLCEDADPRAWVDHPTGKDAGGRRGERPERAEKALPPARIAATPGVPSNCRRHTPGPRATPAAPAPSDSRTRPPHKPRSRTTPHRPHGTAHSNTKPSPPAPAHMPTPKPAPAKWPAAQGDTPIHGRPGLCR